MKHWIYKCRYGIAAGTLITLFTVFALLDVFVLPKPYRSVENVSAGTLRVSTVPDASDDPEDSGNGLLLPKGSEPVITDSSYRDSDISVTITRYRVNETDVYVADVIVSSPEYLFTAFAKDTYGRNIKEPTSETAERTGAILAVNGDFYGARNQGFVIRNSVLYRSAAQRGNQAFAFFQDGSMKIVKESEVTAQELLEQGATQVWSFGPGLVSDGMISISKNQEVRQATNSNPRAAIGCIDKNHYLFVVSDGRTSDNDGLTLYELAGFMKELGAVTAYNLDGGGSSTMVFLGKVINNPTTNGRNTSERSVSDIVCIGYPK